MCDGAADYPITQLNNKTPLEFAQKETMDFLASNGEIGMVKITKSGLSGGSEIGNLSALGYDTVPRATLEATALNAKLTENDTVFRCNFCKLSDNNTYENKIMLDFGVEDISKNEQNRIIKKLNLQFENCEFILGNKYRHCLIMHNFNCDELLTPPQNIIGKEIKEFLPKSKILRDIMVTGYNFAEDYAIWLWGQGKEAHLQPFYDKYNKRAAVITAVNIVRGIARLTDMTIYEVNGANGMLDTNYIGKAEAVLQAYKDGNDFCFLHFEAPDEYSHLGEIHKKVMSIEMIDKALSIVLDGLNKIKESGEPYKILVLPDHPTSVITHMHTADDVPYILYESQQIKNANFQKRNYCEKSAKDSGIYINSGSELINRLLY